MALRERRDAVAELLRVAPGDAVPIVLAALPNSRHQVITSLCDLVEQLVLEAPWRW